MTEAPLVIQKYLASVKNVRIKRKEIWGRYRDEKIKRCLVWANKKKYCSKIPTTKRNRYFGM